MQRRVKDALDVLIAQITQRDLEKLLGISHGYLSKLRSGARNASSELVSTLALLAQDPESRLEELQAFWRTGVQAAETTVEVETPRANAEGGQFQAYVWHTPGIRPVFVHLIRKCGLAARQQARLEGVLVRRPTPLRRLRPERKERLMSPKGKKNNVDITVVVSGQEVSVTVNLHQKVDHLIREALNQSGNNGQPPGSWELRTTDGVLLEQTLTIEAAGIVEGMTLYLNPQAGAGAGG